MNIQETIRRILREEFLNESDPKTGTGKKPKGSDRRLYTDENPSDTVSVKFKTKEDIVTTLNKSSFKSKPHKRQSQIINLIHQRVRAAYQNAKDPETKSRLKSGLDYIENKKEKSKEKTIRLQKEGLHDTSWENDEGDKITLMDLLNTTKDIPVKKVSVNKLKKHLLTWDGDEDEVKKIESADLQYPILIFVEDDGSFISIIDGHHRAQKAVRNDLETIKAKIIPINSLPKDIRKVFSHMGRQEEMKEGNLETNEIAKTLRNARRQGVGTRFPKSAIKSNPQRFRHYTRQNTNEMRNIIKKVLMEHLINESKQGWSDTNGKLTRDYKFSSYEDAIDFVNKVSKIAEKQKHHPKMIVGHNSVKVIMFDHEEGKISDKCHKFTSAVDDMMGEKKTKGEQNESEITEKCWAGYTQKGMKTMFGKKYPNCVKKTK